MSAAQTTTDHERIRNWIEERGGRPSIVRATAENGRSGGILRVDFGEPEPELEEIDWDEFFEVFEDNDLAFLYQDDGESRFNKFVERGDS